MSQTYLAPSPENIKHLRSMDLSGPVVMLNLLRFNPEGGRETYTKYGQAAAPFLSKSGAQVRYRADVAATVIGGDETWDEVILVEYPSIQAFFEMTSHPDYPGNIRSDALLDSRLYCTQPERRS